MQLCSPVLRVPHDFPARMCAATGYAVFLIGCGMSDGGSPLSSNQRPASAWDNHRQAVGTAPSR